MQSFITIIPGPIFFLIAITTNDSVILLISSTIVIIDSSGKKSLRTITKLCYTSIRPYIPPYLHYSFWISVMTIICVCSGQEVSGKVLFELFWSTVDSGFVILKLALSETNFGYCKVQAKIRKH